MRRALAAGAVLLVVRAAGAQASPDSVVAGPRLELRDAGPGAAGRLLRDVLARPHAVIVAPDTGIVLSRTVSAPSTLIVVGGPARLEGHVRGDFVVLGDLVLRPGAVVEGRAIAIGGQIANSSLAVVNGDRVVLDDVGFRATEVGPGVLALDHQPLDRRVVPVVSLPGTLGVRIPSYDRVNGLTLTFGPEVALANGVARLEPTLAYRSQLGRLDAGVAVLWQPSRRVTIEARGARGTLTNDAWIRSDIVNTATSLLAGRDARNYYRADRADATIARTFETGPALVTPWMGARIERGWSVERDSLAASSPWSLSDRGDVVEGMRRANPGVTGGTISAALLGVELRRLAGAVTAHTTAHVEIPVTTPSARRFVQATVDGRVSFPTFGEQSFSAFAHAVFTAGDSTPSQRYAYLGGPSSIPTLRLLEQGGDRLVWLESRYAVPVPAVRLPFAGSPSVTIRHIVGGAGVGRLPTFVQNVGLRVAIASLRLDYMVDPSDPSRYDLGVGFGIR